MNSEQLEKKKKKRRKKKREGGEAKCDHQMSEMKNATTRRKKNDHNLSRGQLYNDEVIGFCAFSSQPELTSDTNRRKRERERREEKRRRRQMGD